MVVSKLLHILFVHKNMYVCVFNQYSYLCSVVDTHLMVGMEGLSRQCRTDLASVCFHYKPG